MDLQFPRVRRSRPHYESVYCTLAHPTEPEALWIRTTVRKRPGEEPTGALWVTWFSRQGVRAAKIDGLPVQPGGHGIICGATTQGRTGSRGETTNDNITVHWDVTFTSLADELRHLHPRLLYAARLPRTKSTSPEPQVDVNGSLTIDGRPVDLTGWTGVLGHNWGTEHAARWIWVRASALGEDGTGWLDAVLGRVRIGTALTPWTAFGALELDGSRHVLGGLARRGTSVTLADDGASIRLTGPGIRVGVDAVVAPDRTVGWEYADPTGDRHEVINSSVAGLRVSVGQEDRGTVYPSRYGIIEIGGDQRAVDVDLQPYPDL